MTVALAALLNALAATAGMATLAGLGFQILAARAVRSFRARPLPLPMPTLRPPVTVLKPLCGEEPELLENLRALCDQGYPGLQIVCGVQCPADPAIDTVRRLMLERPECDITLVVNGRRHGVNRKVGNLINTLSRARHDLLIIADADIRVPPGYLDAIVADLTAPGTGLVTCLYTGHGAEGLWGRLGAAFIAQEFLPAVLAGRALGRRDGCFGATMALSRATLDRIGGFAVLSDHLADDHALGAAVRRLGLPIVLSPCLVSTTVSERNAASLLAHELRWMRTIRVLEPLGHAGSIVTRPLFLALVTLVLAAWAGWAMAGLALLAATLTVRAVTGAVIDRALGTPRTPLWLLAARDLLSAGLLVASFCGTTVRWRDARYRVDSHGRLHLCGDEST